MELHIDQHGGLVHCNDEWFLVMGFVADFILDYASYDPTYSPDDYVFRDGLVVVTPNDGLQYLAALRSRSVARPEFAALLERYGPDRTRPIALIDFDNALFVSSFFDQALEDEVGDGWTGSYSDPMAAAPAELQAIWPPFESG